MILSIADYDAAERAALLTVGYSQYAAFSPKTFADLTFPFRMTDEKELVRYSDFFVTTQPDLLEPGRFFRDISLATDFSFDEVVLLKKLASAVAAINERASSQKIPVYFNHLTQVGLFRVVQALATLHHKKALSVFEAGPGCGYLGALLGMVGHRYASYDIAQGYYLWQNRLYDALFGAEFTEYAAEATRDYAAGIDARIAHVPWWSYMRFHERCPIKADVVLSNANLGEMQTLGLKYMLRVTRRMLEDSEIGLLVFGSVGAPVFAGFADVEREIHEAGFEFVLRKQVYACGLKGRPRSREVIAALEAEVPLYDTSGFGKTFAAKEFISLEPDRMTAEQKFYAFLSDWPKL